MYSLAIHSGDSVPTFVMWGLGGSYSNFSCRNLTDQPGPLSYGVHYNYSLTIFLDWAPFYILAQGRILLARLGFPNAQPRKLEHL
jgi:hypothetical protein